ncbi:MAG: bifunctional folylpolyglutamate synthase/dihydrofolate synthase [Planctomycetes bacterium HGW-Planctomycetes-1]|nr:MAG: bifunctional folylpolyglutamate synthase/dihydrofolate synthase [Planctomycetes bacterium HGW-Planctomycetes-1]
MVLQKSTNRKAGSKSGKVAAVKTAKQFRTVKQALEYLFTRTDYEKQSRLRYNVTTFSLERMEKLLSLVANPHKKLATAHIAGSKGKGSTATMLARMLQANGYSVGLYTSPHVVDLHERIEINGKRITDSELTALVNRIYAPVEKMAKTHSTSSGQAHSTSSGQADQPTFFEIFTAMAFLYFVDKKVDIAVVETGLGGRLDSTNVLEPAVVGITSISIDHQNLLGKTIDCIAKEKAGVIKKGIPIITVPQEALAMKEIKKQALAVKAPLSVTGKDIDFSYRFESSREYGPHTRICLTTPTSKFEHLRVPLPGEHQALNCGLAIAMLDSLKASGYKIDDAKAIAGLKDIKMPGRMEIIHTDPRILIDGAHNAASIRALIQAIGQHVPYDSMIVIFGCGQDKDVRGMLEQLQYGADKVIFTRSNSPKAMYPQDLADMYTEICGKMCQTAMSLRESLRIASSAISKEDLICITGSFYLVGQAKVMYLPK